MLTTIKPWKTGSNEYYDEEPEQTGHTTELSNFKKYKKILNVIP
jgi:hypothetical protein